MLKISIIELIIRGVPEGLLFMWACGMLSKNKIILSRYLVLTIILVVASWNLHIS